QGAFYDAYGTMPPNSWAAAPIASISGGEQQHSGSAALY
ncbi:hypothetical protein A2U01_0055923, partial [Trifolium medium]|nr:hypothetical protein [Trifolium medium]